MCNSRGRMVRCDRYQFIILHRFRSICFSLRNEQDCQERQNTGKKRTFYWGPSQSRGSPGNDKIICVISGEHVSIHHMVEWKFIGVGVADWIELWQQYTSQSIAWVVWDGYRDPSEDCSIPWEAGLPSLGLAKHHRCVTQERRAAQRFEQIQHPSTFSTGVTWRCVHWSVWLGHGVLDRWRAYFTILGEKWGGPERKKKHRWWVAPELWYLLPKEVDGKVVFPGTTPKSILWNQRHMQQGSSQNAYIGVTAPHRCLKEFPITSPSGNCV